MSDDEKGAYDEEEESHKVTPEKMRELNFNASIWKTKGLIKNAFSSYKSKLLREQDTHLLVLNYISDKLQSGDYSFVSPTVLIIRAPVSNGFITGSSTCYQGINVYKLYERRDLSSLREPLEIQDIKVVFSNPPSSEDFSNSTIHFVIWV